MPVSAAPTLVNLANIYFDLGSDEEAKSLLDKAVVLDPNCRAAHRGLALFDGFADLILGIKKQETEPPRVQPSRRRRPAGGQPH